MKGRPSISPSPINHCLLAEICFAATKLQKDNSLLRRDGGNALEVVRLFGGFCVPDYFCRSSPVALMQWPSFTPGMFFDGFERSIAGEARNALTL
jgi:hypothetical protein